MSETKKRFPVRVREFRSAALNVTVKKWEADGEKPAAFFLEFGQRTNRVDERGSPIWVNMEIQIADASGVVDQIQRASAFAVSKEDSEFAHA